ncbi:MAG TPA: 4Fe-4S binding protein [Candidatus Angelobacter sp.]|nr:4Fe-4S binding protein [Candidatus Angelobacter sp.]
MPYVVAEPCGKNSVCVDVCPVDCIHPRRDEKAFEKVTQAYIDPVACINCGLCVPVCPVSAIFAAEDLPEPWQKYTPINASHYEKHGKEYEATARRPGHHGH